ncbi:wee1-like protein kinase 2 [Stylonychia lemnae]|uniref:Wee1-like protein kinase 2 n=1 Tax=Stylonychia lemnae TaxID=5949 RepID=A0A078B3U9_STYLE|nr:wee1-like protein kinase 2 [Stylonychia lemnae]|eukprot:CDW88896.1 wee1-like protein kinase 2 [Stylonychia lemnae]
MSERQTFLRTDSTNHQSQSDPSSQYDMLFDENQNLDCEMKAVNLFPSNIKSPSVIMNTTSIIQQNIHTPNQNLAISQTPVFQKSQQFLQLKETLINKIIQRSPCINPRQSNILSQSQQKDGSMPFQTGQQNKTENLLFIGIKDDKFRLAPADQRTPKIINSPRVKFPLLRDENKSTERMKEPLVKGISLNSSNLLKRSFNQFISEKSENQQKVQSMIVCQRNLFGANMQESPLRIKFMRNDQAFLGKFSSGTTPKQDKPLFLPQKQNQNESENYSQLSFQSSQNTNQNQFPQIILNNQISPSKSKFLRNIPSVPSSYECSTHKNQNITQSNFDLNSGNMSNPFKMVAAQSRLRRMSEYSIDEKEVPDTPMVEYRHSSYLNDTSQRESLLTNSDFNFKPPSRFQEDFNQKGILGKDGFEKTCFLQEVYALSALSVGFESPHIVRYYSGWIEDQNLYIVMELCQESLRSYSKKRRTLNGYQMAELEIKQIMRDVCLGLNELHNKGIVHLDIKPENILLSQNGTFKIGDLGMARLLTKIIEEHDIPEGDCRYLAKELLNEDPNIPIPDLTKADIFALGMIIYELVEGVDLMRNGAQWHDLRENNIHFNERAKQEFSSQLLSVIEQMLNPNPDLRPSPGKLLQSFLQSPQEIEISLIKQENQILKEKLQKIEESLRQQGFPNVDQLLSALQFQGHKRLQQSMMIE